ncbi:MAG TPA: 16S rRNA (guanine(527)-N(7))-methyltransferase RsmG [Candidatus Peribacteraceae bacterium]|nr:16S rRNA (guanine(527)-N(7))-methyltransferase RsmG [Candidatus Peribacteraceae bacterium]
MITIPKEMEPKLRELMQVFLAENANINLSAFRTEQACWIGNILDSLSFIHTAHAVALKPGSKILDLGTGGGFPLLPLAIALPEHQYSGMDATQKKIAAVNRILKALNLSNVETIAGRSEELGHEPAYREQYDVVLSRGLAELPTLLEYCAPFVKPYGKIVLWKSMTIDQELKDSLLARAELSCHLVDHYRYELPGDFGTRQLLVFEKAAPLSRKYPRGLGIPKKDPLM